MIWGKSEPKSIGWYLCTVRDDYNRRFVMPIYRDEHPSGNWHWVDFHGEVIAATRFPKAYMGEKK